MITKLSCAHTTRELLLLCSPATACPLADFARADIAAATAPPRRTTTTTTLKPTTIPDRLQAHMHAPQRTVAASCQHHQRRAIRTVCFLGLFGAPSLPSTSDISPRRAAPVTGGELGYGKRPRTNSIRRTANALNQVVCVGTPKRLRCARY